MDMPIISSFSRLFSDYLYFSDTKKSPSDFHNKVVKAIDLFSRCLQHHSARSCAYNSSLAKSFHVRKLQLFTKLRNTFEKKAITLEEN